MFRFGLQSPPPHLNLNSRHFNIFHFLASLHHSGLMKSSISLFFVVTGDSMSASVRPVSPRIKCAESHQHLNELEPVLSPLLKILKSQFKWGDNHWYLPSWRFSLDVSSSLASISSFSFSFLVKKGDGIFPKEK